jgi:hypothetical protein
MSASPKLRKEHPDAYDGDVPVQVNMQFGCRLRVPSWVWDRWRQWSSPVEQREECSRLLEEMLLSELREALCARAAGHTSSGVYFGFYADPERIDG